jgi:hypothetical protein
MIKLKDILIENKIINKKKPLREFILTTAALAVLFKFLMKWYKNYSEKNPEGAEKLNEYINFEKIQEWLDGKNKTDD